MESTAGNFETCIFPLLVLKWQGYALKCLALQRLYQSGHCSCVKGRILIYLAAFHRRCPLLLHREFLKTIHLYQKSNEILLPLLRQGLSLFHHFPASLQYPKKTLPCLSTQVSWVRYLLFSRLLRRHPWSPRDSRLTSEVSQVLAMAPTSGLGQSNLTAQSSCQMYFQDIREPYLINSLCLLQLASILQSVRGGTRCGLLALRPRPLFLLAPGGPLIFRAILRVGTEVTQISLPHEEIARIGRGSQAQIEAKTFGYESSGAFTACCSSANRTCAQKSQIFSFL